MDFFRGAGLATPTGPFEFYHPPRCGNGVASDLYARLVDSQSGLINSVPKPCSPASRIPIRQDQVSIFMRTLSAGNPCRYGRVFRLTSAELQSLITVYEQEPNLL